jgi:cell shape-determining protein MreD
MPLAWGKSWHDLWNTLFWPSVLVLLARHTRALKR